MGLFGSRDCLRACVPGRTRDPRSYSNAALLYSPRQSAPPLRVGRMQGESPSAGIQRASCSVSPVTAIRKYGPRNAFRETFLYEQAFAAQTRFVVDVNRGYFGAHKCWRACSPCRRRDSRSYGAVPLLPCPRRPAAALWVGGIQNEVPSAEVLRFPCSVHLVTTIRK